jgi:drug/metabolite transporter (DMT)-like permease
MTLNANWLLLLTLVAIWGTSFLFNAKALAYFSPLEVTTYRLILGAVILLGFVYLKKLQMPRDKGSLLKFLLMGLIGNALPFFLISWGQQQIPSGTTGVLMAVMPIVTILLAHFFIENETLNRFKILGAITAFIGVAVLLQPTPNTQGSFWHEIAILAAASCYGINTILVRRISTFHPIVGGAGMLSGAVVLTLPVLLLSNNLTLHVPYEGYLFIIWMGVVPTAFASILYFLIIQRAGPSFLSNINFMIPVVAFFSGALLLGETISVGSFIALLIILSGIFLTRYRS